MKIMKKVSVIRLTIKIQLHNMPNIEKTKVWECLSNNRMYMGNKKKMKGMLEVNKHTFKVDKENKDKEGIRGEIDSKTNSILLELQTSKIPDKETAEEGSRDQTNSTYNNSNKYKSILSRQNKSTLLPLVKLHKIK